MVEAAKKYSHLIQCVDAAFTTKAFQFANKVGIWGESLYQYNISDKSISYTFVPSRVEADQALFNFTKEYLSRFGKISKTNQDYLYAIYLGLISETLKVIYNSELQLPMKLKYIGDIFDCQITKDMLQREADPIFHNLKGRATFLRSTINWIRAQNGWEKQRIDVEQIASNMGINLIKSEWDFNC